MLILIGLVGIGLFVSAVIIVITVVSVLSLRNGLPLTPVAPEEDHDWAEAVATHAGIARQWDFEFLGCYVTQQAGVKAFIAAWKHSRRPTYFCVYVFPGTMAYDFATVFDDDRGLTTGSTMDGQFLPHRPGHYTQTFSGCEAEELFNRHAVAEQYLIASGRMEQHTDPLPFEERLSREATLQAAYIRSLPLWPLRALYWYLLKKRGLHNKSIDQLHQERLIRLPHEPGFKEFFSRR